MSLAQICEHCENVDVWQCNQQQYSASLPTAVIFLQFIII